MAQLKLGIIGLPGSGKTTVFRALIGGGEASDRKGRQDVGLAAVKAPDERLDFLAVHYGHEQGVAVDVEYLDIQGVTGEGKPGREVGDKTLSHARAVDALIHCVRFFHSQALGPPDPLRDLDAVEAELIFSDLAVSEKRIERITKDFKKGRKDLGEELGLLEEARDLLNEEKPLRCATARFDSEKLKGFSFLSLKPCLYLVNCGEDIPRDEIQSTVEKIKARIADQTPAAVDWLYADTEAEVSRLPAEDAAEFLAELGIQERASRRIIRASLNVLNLMVFFTVGRDEVRAWPVIRGATALAAAGAVHSDMQKGFIRAEVVSYEHFKKAGSMTEAKKAGKVRLEGKEYRVIDGDIIQFLFNV
jgi:hypothetical protein